MSASSCGPVVKTDTEPVPQYFALTLPLLAM
jgi:hypothetical protein